MFSIFKKKAIIGLLGVAFALSAYFFLPESCPEAARRTFAIFIIAAAFWAFEILEPFVTSLLIILLLIFTLAKPDGVMGMGKDGYVTFLIPFSSPVIILFFGGFALAESLSKYKVDLFIAGRFLGEATENPYVILLRVIFTTAFLSMWLSNTVTTVIMLGILTPYLSLSSLSDNFRKALILGVSFSANIGGISTPIASPPNAIAIGLLNTYGIYISFFEWMLICIPLALILLGIGFLILITVFPLGSKRKKLRFPHESLTKNGQWVLAITVITIMLFMSSPIHEIPEALIALLCVGVLTTFGLLNRNDIKQLDWDILILMWGGLALGIAVEKSGLAHWFVTLSSLFQDKEYAILVFSLLTISISLFMSNTAVASLILPIGLGTESIDKTLFAVTIALICSCGMIFPISTPPNALAFATGVITTKDMAKTGILIVLISLAIILLGYHIIIPNILAQERVIGERWYPNQGDIKVSMDDSTSQEWGF